MRICIFGAGAVGGHLAVKLSLAGHDVSVVARGENLEAIKARGFSLRTREQELRVVLNASSRSVDLGRQDCVISALKANSLAALAADVAPLLANETPVIFVQNGIPWWYRIGLAASRPEPPDLASLDPNGDLQRSISPERAIAGVIQSANEIVAPGIVLNVSADSNALMLGELDDRETARIRTLRTMLNEAGINSPAVPDIRQAIWQKLLLNMTASILCLLTGRRLSMLRHDDRMFALFQRMANEAIAIAFSHGVDISDFDGEEFRRVVSDHLPSIRQDYERGRPLELDSMLLIPLAFGRIAGVDTPCLEMAATVALQMNSPQRRDAPQ
jgi:2-dehydropantoate 2-reductase